LKPHKDADLGMIVETGLSSPKLAELCEQAARDARGALLSGTSIRLEEATPGKLIYSVRGPAGLIEIMTFEVRVLEGDGRHRLSTHISTYQMSQDTIGGFIPAGRKRMNGLKNFRSFNELVATAVQSDDPSAQVTLDARIPA
jgi:hypothetical protein